MTEQQGTGKPSKAAGAGADAVAAEDRQAYASGMADDLLDQLVSRLQGEIGVTTNPAAILGVDAGKLAVGSEADLALIDPAKPWVVDSDMMAAAAGNTPFDKQGVEGRVTALFKGGVPIPL